jgi:CRP-like cAMP-binding protein
LSIEAVKNNSKEFEISYDRQGLADYLGVERSAMSAELSRLRQEGIIDTKKNKFKLLK